MGVKGRVEPCNHKAFSKKSLEGDYWAGLLLADGHVNTTQGTPTTSLTLKWDDRGHVEAFRDFMCSENKVVKRPPMGLGSRGKGTARVTIRSALVASDLEKYGVVPRKTGKENPPSGLSESFWRGVVDGDGCVTRCGGRPHIELVGSDLVCKKFLEFSRSVGLGAGVSLHRKRKIWSVSLTGPEAISMCAVLYASGPSLPRKKRLAQDLLRG